MKISRQIAFVIGTAALLAARSQAEAPSAPATEGAPTSAAPEAPPAAPKVAKGRLAPRDDCASIEGVPAFRASLAKAVAARDADALAALFASDVRLDFGGGGGVAELRTRLAADGKLWGELADLMPLGCARSSGGGIVIPWVFEQDLGELDPFMAMLVTGEDVPVRAAADAGSAQVATVSWDAVELLGGFKPDAAAQQVKLAGGKTGYIDTRRLRSLLDYRLYASEADGVWKIDSFVAGD